MNRRLKGYVILSGILCMMVTSFAQKNDYIWLSGFDSHAPDTFPNFRLGNTKMNFNQSPVAVSFDSLKMNFNKTNTSYSDSEGNLLFYSNGIYVANALDETMVNGDSLNGGWVQYDWDPSITVGGYRNIQGIIALPDVGHSDHFYLLHSLTDSMPGSQSSRFYFPNVLITSIDRSANAGHGQVIYKNHALLTGNFGNDLTATKHGNGRDWWILIQKRNTNCFYRVLLDSAGLNVIDSTCLGVTMPEDGISASCFSPDGTKFAYISGYSGLSIYDFDRCTGELGNALNLPMPIIADSGLFIMGVAISPNSRFLYVSVSRYLYQFDLWNPDIFHNIDTIGKYEGWFYNNSIIAEDFNWPQLAPDGKIYITCGSGTPFFNVINSPDLKGDSCNFVPHGFPLATLCRGVPNFPNYRLGALTQSQCDSLSTATQDVIDAKEKMLKVFPNPANDVATVDYGFTDWNKGAVSLEISNDLGQIVYTQTLPMYSGFQKIDASQFAAGHYSVFIKRNNGVVAANKLVIVH